MAQPGNNLVDNIVDTQKKAVDSMVENTKKMTGGNNLLNETIEKGSEWYKNWLETQKSIFSKVTEKATAGAESVKETVEETVAGATETAKEAASKLKEFNDNWFSTQMNFAKQMWESGQEWMKNFTGGAANKSFTNPFVNNNANPFAHWQNAANPMNNWMNASTSWMNPAQGFNPFTGDNMKKATDSWTNLYNQYTQMLTSSLGEWQKNMQNGTVQDAYKQMINVGEGFAKFAELWEPMLKSIQDKSFNMDVYRQYMKPEAYKEMLDKYFGFLPSSVTDYYKQMGGMMNGGMTQMNDAAWNCYRQWQNLANNPAWNNSQAFAGALGAYNQWYALMNETIAPFNKMVTPNQYTKMMNEWSDIGNRIMVYNVKNAELQYMMYSQGQKVLDALAESTAQKIKEGKEVKSIIALYQEWLGISDKVYVSLFESDAYTKLMTEVNSMQMKLQKDLEHQSEKMMGNIPVAKRSEMDEVYKTIYDLKKQVKELERTIAALTTKETPKETNGAAAEDKTAKATKKA